MTRRERQKRRRRHRGHPAKRIALMTFGVALCAAIVGGLAAVGWVVAVANSAPNISDIKPKTPLPPSEIFAADGTLLGYVHTDTLFVPLAGAQIPQLMKDATIAIEDRRFYHHGALDYQGILRAGIKDVFSNGSGLQGASTLTMQLVDNEYLPHQVRETRSLKYKIEQAKLAMQLESKHKKDWILDAYLNDVPYGAWDGETAQGVGAAASLFFNQPIAKLDLAQVALLAGLPQSPTDYNPFLYPARALARRHEVIKAMIKAGYITREQGVAADHQPLQVSHGSLYTSAPQLPYIFHYALQQAEARYGQSQVEKGGMKIYTTIDPRIEQEAQNAVEDSGRVTPAPPGAAAALASVNPTNGHIVALAGTESYDQKKFFYPVQAQRQTGSAAKVFALMTLIHDYDGDPNQTYYTSQELKPGWYPGAPSWSVHTDTNQYAGSISITQATTFSDNTVFAQLVVDEGVSKFEATARAMGLPASQMIGAPAEVLGGWKDGITMLQMADADAVLANGGSYIPPTIIDHVVLPSGRVDSSWGIPRPTRVFSDGETYAATQVLKTVLTSPGGTAYGEGWGCPAAGKTGTAENLANAWFVGYTPKLSTAVWVGYPSGNIGLGPNGFGGTLAAPLWKIFMQSASQGYCGDFPQPSTYWTGTAYVGQHSSSGPLGGGTGKGKNGKYGTGNQYNNSSLYAQPPQAPPGKTGTTGGNGTGTTGTGTGTTGTGAGKGGGGGTAGGGGGTTGGTGGAGVPTGH